MTNIYRKTAIASALALTLGLSSLAMADSDTFNVTATVDGVCSMTAGNDLAFGSYNPVTAAAVNGSTTVAVTCSNGMTGTEVGLAYTGNMVFDTTNNLSYGLFQDAGLVTTWGDTVAVDRQTVTADGTQQIMTVYGQIDANQTTAPIGSYTETVTATVYF
jgi:spore coat protein U-like protein